MVGPARSLGQGVGIAIREEASPGAIGEAGRPPGIDGCRRLRPGAIGGGLGFGTEAEEGGDQILMEGLVDLVEQVVSGDLLFHGAAEDDEAAGARPWNDRRFPPLGVKQMPSDGPPPFRRGGGGLTWRRCCYAQRLSLRGRSPSPLWLRTSPKRRIRPGTTRISRVRCGKAKRGCASRVPGGKAIEPARRPEPGSGKADRSSPTATTGTRRTVASTPDVRRVEPHGCKLAEGFVSSRSVAIPLSTHPFTARKVHRNPIQNGGCNEGNSSAMERVSYLYK